MPSDNNETKDHKLTPSEQRASGFGGFSRQFALALELPFIMVATVAVGGVIGYFLDQWLHTKPYLMLVCGFLGFFAGLRDMLRRVGKQ
ncbi:MAG TPA: AtpZ/AtpI family protein [Candidatus Sulfotelmatobacter sp.]|nr:AtpZ/AtpI family protein [Candidatus Sulfotelmatobacter sp.]